MAGSWFNFYKILWKESNWEAKGFISSAAQQQCWEKFCHIVQGRILAYLDSTTKGWLKPYFTGFFYEEDEEREKIRQFSPWSNSGYAVCPPFVGK